MERNYVGTFGKAQGRFLDLAYADSYRSARHQVNPPRHGRVNGKSVRVEMLESDAAPATVIEDNFSPISRWSHCEKRKTRGKALKAERAPLVSPETGPVFYSNSAAGVWSGFLSH